MVITRRLADVNTSVSESAIRECSEEAGAVVMPKRIIAIHLANKHNKPDSPFTIYKIFVECELVENCFKENTETLDAQFFEADKLPELSFEEILPIRSKCVSKLKNVKYFETILIKKGE